MEIRPIATEEIEIIMPLMKKVNSKTPSEILHQRTLEMASLSNYECIGLFIDIKRPIIAVVEIKTPRIAGV